MATKKTSTKTNVSKTAKKAANKAMKSPVFIGIAAGVIVLALVLCYIFKPAEFKIITNSIKTAVVETVKDMASNQEVTIDDLKEQKGTGSTTTVKPATGTSAPDAAPTVAENDHMYFGNPSGATTDVSNKENYLMIKPQYSLSYNSVTCNPNWVMWHLGSENLGKADRSDDFRPDENLPKDFYAVVKADYQYTKYGFDRGHVCPSADRTASQSDNSATFYMTNMIPQAPDCNRVVWKDFEAYERGLVANSGKELYVVAGPSHEVGGESAAGKFDSIVLTGKGKGHEIAVPEYCWKIVLILDEATNDLSRVTVDTPVIALWMPNKQGIGKTGSWEQFLTSVDDIEAKTGYDFLACIPNEIEDVLEAKVYTVKK